ncbi:hypothetical protein BJX70DRAFT_328326 [Aspergillus crustosus]
MVTWGAVMIGNAFVTNKGGLYATRFLLGVVCRFKPHTCNPANKLGRSWTVPGSHSADDILVSAGRDVIATTILLCVPTPLPNRKTKIDEIDICGNISSIIGGLLAYAFDTVSGAAGLSGWQWYAFRFSSRTRELT